MDKEDVGVWGRRMGTCICMAESLCCAPEIITTLLLNYTPIENKNLKKKRKEISSLFSTRRVKPLIFNLYLVLQRLGHILVCLADLV